MAALVDEKIKKVEKEVHDKVVDLVAHASSPEHAVDESLKQVAHAHTKDSKPIVPPAAKKTEKLAQTMKDEQASETKDCAEDGRKIKKQPVKKPSGYDLLSKNMENKAPARCKYCAKKSD